MFSRAFTCGFHGLLKQVIHYPDPSLGTTYYSIVVHIYHSLFFLTFCFLFVSTIHNRENQSSNINNLDFSFPLSSSLFSSRIPDTSQKVPHKNTTEKLRNGIIEHE